MIYYLGSINDIVLVEFKQINYWSYKKITTKGHNNNK